MDGIPIPSLSWLAIPATVTGAYLMLPVFTAVHMPVTANGDVRIALTATGGRNEPVEQTLDVPETVPRQFTLPVVLVTVYRLTPDVTEVRAAPRDPTRFRSGSLGEAALLLEPRISYGLMKLQLP